MDKYKDIINDAKFTDQEMETPIPVISIQNKTIAYSGNFITINGLPKSRKTTFSTFLIASAILRTPIFDISVNIDPDDKIIIIDTEQGIFDFTRQTKLLKNLIKSRKLPEQVTAYLFRKYDPDDILNSTYILIKEQRPKIVIIDNLTELVINPNDMTESKKVIQFLKRITAEFNCVVVCLLHLAKSNLQALGNLGSYADRGAQTVLKVTLDAETQTSTLEASLMRSDLFFSPITIGWNAESKCYEKTDSVIKTQKRKFVLNDLNESDHYNRLNVIFRNSSEIVYGELVEEIKKIYGVGTNIAKQQIIPYLVGNQFMKSNKGIYTK